MAPLCERVMIWAPDGSSSAAVVPGVTEVPTNSLGKLLGDGEVDIIHDSGLWLPHNHTLASLARSRRIPRIISTRGMLDPWALRHKRWKKRLAWGLYQRMDCQWADAIHVTSAQELETVRSIFPENRILCIPNGVDLPATIQRDMRPPPPSVALFIGRLHPVKGVLELVEAWHRVRPQGWVLRVAGPDEGGYRRVLEEAIIARNLGHIVTLIGEVDDFQKRHELLSCSLLVLPSHSESFGIVVAEALAHCRPVLTTLNVPWPDLEREGCGWRVPDTVEGLASGISSFAIRTREELLSMGHRGRDLVTKRFSWTSISNDFKALYTDLAPRTKRTSC
jgi:glycosyltransferase involved in cell wall biosynthesis